MSIWGVFNEDIKMKNSKRQNEVDEWTAITPGEVEREEKMEVRERVERKIDSSRSLKRLVMTPVFRRASGRFVPRFSLVVPFDSILWRRKQRLCK